MHSIFLSFCIALLSTTIAQSLSNFQPTTEATLNVIYGSDFLSAGAQLIAAQAQVQPIIGTGSAPLEGRYILIMVDGGTASQTNTSTAGFLQWALCGLAFVSYEDRTLASSASSQVIAPYAGPTPRPGTALHEYIFLLFQQPASFTLPMAFAGFGAENRTKFELGDFAEQAGLRKPLTANYFISGSNSTRTGNATATGVGGGSEASISSRPVTGEGVGWDRCGVLVELCKVLIIVTGLLAVHRMDQCSMLRDELGN